jgi:hypothetical protein
VRLEPAATASPDGWLARQLGSSAYLRLGMMSKPERCIRRLGRPMEELGAGRRDDPTAATPLLPDGWHVALTVQQLRPLSELRP